MSAYSDADYIAAFKRFHADDECELAGDPQVSPGADPGAWVQAWVWVPDHECEAMDCTPLTDEEDGEPLHCRECGSLMQIDASGVSHHLHDPKRPGSVDEYDYDLDADHVAIAEREG